MSGPEGLPAALFGFTSSKQVTEREITDQLGQIFGSNAENPTHIIIQNWAKESQICPPNVADLKDYQTFGHQIYQKPYLHGRLHWSSTETSTMFAGHIEGALEAAERTTSTILKPTLLSTKEII